MFRLPAYIIKTAINPSGARKPLAPPPFTQGRLLSTSLCLSFYSNLVCLQQETPHPSGKPDTFPLRGRHPRCSTPGYSFCAAGAFDMFFPGHAPGKNTTTREHFRRNAAKPARRPASPFRRESSECNERFPDRSFRGLHGHARGEAL